MTTAVAAVTLVAAPALAAGDTDDSLSPIDTPFIITFSNFKITENINGLSVTVTCTSVTMDAKTRLSGLTADITSGPAFSGCTDNLGGTDTITASGSWSVTNTDTGDPATEPQSTLPCSTNPCDQMAFNIPAGGFTFTSSAFRGCTTTAGSSRPTSSSFDDKSSGTLTNANVNATGSGCTVSSPLHFSATFTFSTAISDTIT